MPFTLVGFSESQDSAVLVNVAALADPHIRTAGDDIIVPDWAPLLIAVQAFGLNVTRAQLISPSLRRVLNYEISPLERATLPASPHRWRDLFPDGLALSPDEALNAQVAEDAAGAIRTTVLCWLADGPLSPVSGDIFTVRYTAAVAAVANAWSNMAITFDQVLYPGEYACVGARLSSTNLQAFRFVVPGAFNRPGGIGAQAVGDILLPSQRRGGWGEWFRFRHNSPPTLDVLANAADAAFTGEMDLIFAG